MFELFLAQEKVLYPTPSHEIHCDKALVFAREYKNFFNKQYGYPFDRLEVVGNPSLDRVFKIENETVSELGEVKFLTEMELNLQSNRDGLPALLLNSVIKLELK